MDSTVTAFFDDRQIATGTRDAVMGQLEEGYPADLGNIRIFDDMTGRMVDLDYWDALKTAPPRGPGRPRMGVQAREITLLPRHWDWLALQPGGASAVLRRLIDEARRAGRTERERLDAVYHFLHHSCGDRPGYEEALRALYAGDGEGFDALIAGWPDDVRAYAGRLRSE